MWMGSLFVRKADRWFEDGYRSIVKVLEKAAGGGRVTPADYMKAAEDLDVMLGGCLEGRDTVAYLVQRLEGEIVGGFGRGKEKGAVQVCLEAQRLVGVVKKLLARVEKNHSAAGDLVHASICKLVATHQKQLMKEALEAIDTYRATPSPATLEKVTSLVSILTTAGYDETFHTALQVATCEYYRSTAALMSCAEIPVVEYSERVTRMLEVEATLISKAVAHQEWREKLIKIADYEMLRTYKEVLVVQAMDCLKKCDWELFATIQKLVEKINPEASEELLPAITRSVEAEAASLRSKFKPHVTHDYLHQLWALHAKYNVTPLMQKGREQGLAIALNIDQDFQADLCLVLLEETAAVLSLADIDAVHRIADTLNYITDRHVFNTGYRRLLCKRLLKQQQDWEETEGPHVEVLSGVMCGTQIGGRVQEMLKDRRRSAEALSEWSGVKVFEPLLLSGACWPGLRADDDVILPSGMAEPMKEFMEWYAPVDPAKPAKAVRWVFSLGRVKLSDVVTKAQVVVGTYQGVLLLYLGGDGVTDATEEAISTATGLSMDTVKATINSLLTAPIPLVKSVGKAVSLVPPEEGVELQEATAIQYSSSGSPVASNARNADVLSTLLRLVKRQKTIRLPALLSEARTVLQPSYGALKAEALTKGVQALISMGFLERDTSDKNLILYVTRTERKAQ